MRSVFLSVCAVLVLSLVQPVSAQEAAAPSAAEAEAMKKAMEQGAPGEAHKILEKMAGEWTYTVKHKAAADAPEQTSEGTAKHELVLGGRFLKQTVSGVMDMGGQSYNFEGMGLIGHDNVKGAYQTLWADNITTGMMTATAEYDAATQTLKEKGSFHCPMKGKEISYSSELKIIDDTHLSYTMTDHSSAGTPYVMMEMQYTRK